MFKERTERLKRDAVPDHVRVYEAIAARNPAAARAAMIALIDLAYTDTAQRKKPRGR
jgi:DNA-binding FadR family transcriptional regulator